MSAPEWCEPLLIGAKRKRRTADGRPALCRLTSAFARAVRGAFHVGRGCVSHGRPLIAVAADVTLDAIRYG
jgi:hypothetical protein